LPTTAFAIPDCNKRKHTFMIKKRHFLIKQKNICSTAGYSSHDNAFKRDIKKEGKKRIKKVL